MNVCGVICEYNPLHNGHLYHLGQARLRSGCDYLVAVMSGAFVQRGEPAAFDKWSRARWALQAGADLVLELPAAYCLQSAEGFARGGVGTLAGTGVLTHLSFGCETDDLALLKRVASLLNHETPAFQESFRRFLREGLPFAAARERALRAELPPGACDLLRQPNAVLGIEYLRALEREGLDVLPIPILRHGSAHDAEGFSHSRFASAKAVRGALSIGDSDALSFVPDFVSRDIEGTPPLSMEAFTDILLYLLRTQTPAQLKALHGVGEGLEHALLKGGEGSALSEVRQAMKSKRYPLSRVNRILCSLLCGFTSELALLAGEGPAYLRVLGLRRTAFPLLSEISARSPLPLLTKKADMGALSPRAARLLQLDLRASDTAALASVASQTRRARRDYTEKLILL